MNDLLATAGTQTIYTVARDTLPRGFGGNRRFDLYWLETAGAGHSEEEEQNLKSAHKAVDAVQEESDFVATVFGCSWEVECY